MKINNKLKQSETIIVKRSEIKFAPYNPRKKDAKVVNELKKNFKKVGFLGGIIWNKITGNLVGGHKRVEAMDLIYSYDGMKEKDYDIKVEKIEIDEKTEKEQNIFLNNKNVQGTTDFELMASIIPDINILNAGLEDYDINLIENLVPNFTFGNNNEIKEDIILLEEETKRTKENIKREKKRIKELISEKQQPFYFTVTFDSAEAKAEFLEGIGLNGDSIYITSKEFISKLYEE